MKNLGTNISRTILTLAVAGMGFTLTPRTASAEFLDFTVNDPAVEGQGVSFTADKINGAYSERIDLGLGAGNEFEVSLYVNFSQYLTNEGALSVFSQLNVVGAPAQFYAMYALVTASGTFTGNGSDATPFVFTFEDADAHVFLDPNSNTTFTLPGAGDANLAVTTGNAGDDSEVLSGTTLIPGISGGNLKFSTLGNFQLVFSDPTLVNTGAILGSNYFTDLPLFGIRAFNNGDFDDVSALGQTGGIIVGDVSLTFQPVPEPATMALLGLGLAGSAMAARRRRKA